MKILLLFALAAVSGMDWTDAMLRLTGASCLEELEENEVEHFEHLHRNPLDLNRASRSQLTASRLLDQFQTACLLDYRTEYGDILSFSELALISGFGEETSEALKAFTVLRTSDPPGQRKRKQKLHGGIMAKGSLKASVGSAVQTAYGAKADISYGNRAELRWSSRTTYSEPEFGVGTISGIIYGKRALGKVLGGHFAARFGQGLTQWSGFSLDGFSSIEAFRKNATGLSATGSFSPELCGAGAEVNLGDFCISAAVSFTDGITQICNASWTGRSATIGITSVGRGIGMDWKTSKGRLSSFGEISYRNGPAALAGFVLKTGSSSELALQARYLHPDFKEDWSGIALGFRRKWLTATADAAYHQAKGKRQLKCLLLISPKIGPFSPTLRANFRWRPEDADAVRMDLRGDLIWKSPAGWTAGGRYNALWCKSFAWLWYVDSGWSSPVFSSFARFTVFCIDNWDDRIYVYERDAPGNYNSPAYYGRGFAASLVSSLKAGRAHSLHLRISYVSYPWNLEAKPAVFEAKLQYTLKL